MRYFLSTLLVLFCVCSNCQTLKIKGKILDDQLEDLPGVEIYGQDSVPLATSDLDGTFEIELQNVDTLYLIFIAMERVKIPVTNNCLNIEAILLAEPIYHLKSHRKIDRLRKRTFDDRIELHHQAYTSGKFQNKMPCFEYEFTPHKPELDEIRKWIKQKREVINKELKELEEGGTIYVPYGTTWRYDGTDRTALHRYSSYTDETEFNCIIAGTLISKDKRGNITYQVTDITECNYKSITLDNQSVKLGDTLEHNMKYFRAITVSNRR